ncbi:hypothetical protein [Kribbella qitaiheensis]|nr:hypothetical protein [Kribbella qitaiheensis]
MPQAQYGPIKVSHGRRPALSDGPAAYEMFQQKQDGAIKILLTP